MRAPHPRILGWAIVFTLWLVPPLAVFAQPQTELPEAPLSAVPTPNWAAQPVPPGWEIQTQAEASGRVQVVTVQSAP